MLVNGTWQGQWHPVQDKDEDGRFLRQQSQFRNRVAEASAHPAEPGRYRLYVARICPWASRILLVRALKRLQDVIPVTVLDPELTEQGWRFGAESDPELGASYMHELYTASQSDYTGRATVPVLWDRHRKTIVNNESADLIQILNTAFDAFTSVRLDLRPRYLEDDIDALNQDMYHRLNNGVYRAGFASTQGAHDEAVNDVFDFLDTMECRLRNGGPYLFGGGLTESDVRLFVTLVRFDVAYHGIFKTNRRRIADYPALFCYMQKMLQMPGVLETVDLDHIKRGYYSIRALNPTGILPQGPEDPLGLKMMPKSAFSSRETGRLARA